MAKPRFYDLIISDVRKDTSSSVEISFEIPKLLSTIFAFVPGQYLTLRADVGVWTCAGLILSVRQLGPTRYQWGSNALKVGPFPALRLR